MQLVAAGKYLLLLIRPQRVLYHRVVLIRAENQTESGIVSFGPPFMVVVIHVKLKLAEVLVCELAGLEVYDHVALEDCVIENQIDIEMVAIQRQPLLPGYKRKTLAQFQQEMPADFRSALVPDRFLRVEAIPAAPGIP